MQFINTRPDQRAKTLSLFLRQHGIEVIERIPHQFQSVDENKNYLETKKQKLGHLLKENLI